MDILGLKQRYGLVGSIGRRCIKMRKGTLLLVRNVKERGIYLKGVLCLYIITCKLIYSTYGELTSWGLSLIQMDMSIY
jgi:hypothetical protein